MSMLDKSNEEQLTAKETEKIDIFPSLVKSWCVGFQLSCLVTQTGCPLHCSHLQPTNPVMSCSLLVQGGTKHALKP